MDPLASVENLSYKELQTLAMSMNLPGKMKVKHLVISSRDHAANRKLLWRVHLFSSSLECWWRLSKLGKATTNKLSPLFLRPIVNVESSGDCNSSNRKLNSKQHTSSSQVTFFSRGMLDSAMPG